MNRIRAGLIHLALTAMVVGAAFVTIYFLWYPEVLFDAAGGRRLLLLIAAVDVTLGPLLTFIVFAPKKKSLKLDLAVIAMLQLAGLAYGAWVMYEARPVFIVFVKDRFELARANQIAPDDLLKARAKGFGELSFTGPRIVASRLPTDPDENFRIMMSAMSGTDLQGFPQHFVAYDEMRAEVLAQGQPISKLRAFNPDRAGEVDRVLASVGRDESKLRYLPMRAGASDLTVLIDGGDGRVIRIVDLRPWEYR